MKEGKRDKFTKIYPLTRPTLDVVIILTINCMCHQTKPAYRSTVSHLEYHTVSLIRTNRIQGQG